MNLNRVYKFRAWDNEQNKMMDLSRDYCEEIAMDILENGRGHTIMQFTGAKDKTGREVYDGDIIKGPSDTNPCGGRTNKRKDLLFIVGWSQGMYWGGWNLFRVDGKFDKYRTFPKFTESEVVGNKYENPELLK